MHFERKLQYIQRAKAVSRFWGGVGAGGPRGRWFRGKRTNIKINLSFPIFLCKKKNLLSLKL